MTNTKFENLTLRNCLLVFFLMVLVVEYFVAIRPVNELIDRLIHYTFWVGTVLVVCQALFLGYFRKQGFSSFISIILCGLNGNTTFALFFWIVRDYIDLPNDSNGKAEFEYFIMPILLHVSLLYFLYVWHKEKPLQNSYFKEEVTDPTQRDLAFIAPHEAAHALVYTALGSIPDDLEVFVNKDNNPERPRGYISGIKSLHSIESVEFMEWYMLVLLAGQRGEKLALNKLTAGSKSDHQKWIRVAQEYLSVCGNGVFYLPPLNNLEISQNEAKMDNLMEKQRAALDDFLKNNREVFDNLAKALLDQGEMDGKTLTPYLKRVKLPDDFPRPLGEFKEFGGPWPKDKGYCLFK